MDRSLVIASMLAAFLSLAAGLTSQTGCRATTDEAMVTDNPSDTHAAGAAHPL